MEKTEYSLGGVKIDPVMAAWQTHHDAHVQDDYMKQLSKNISQGPGTDSSAAVTQDFSLSSELSAKSRTGNAKQQKEVGSGKVETSWAAERN